MRKTNIDTDRGELPERDFADESCDVRRGLDPELVAGLRPEHVVRLATRRGFALRVLSLPDHLRQLLTETDGAVDVSALLRVALAPLRWLVLAVLAPLRWLRERREDRDDCYTTTRYEVVSMWPAPDWIAVYRGAPRDVSAAPPPRDASGAWAAGAAWVSALVGWAVVDRVVERCRGIRTVHESRRRVFVGLVPGGERGVIPAEDEREFAGYFTLPDRDELMASMAERAHREHTEWLDAMARQAARRRTEPPS